MSNQSGTKEQGMDLSSLFKVAGQALAANQNALNEADTYNHDHGNNMVQTFNMISQVMASNKNAPPAQQLSQASQYLAQNSKSGSAQAYSQGLAQAAQQFKGQSAVTPDNAMMLVQSLLGGGQPQQQAGGDLLGALMGGGQTGQAQQQAGGDLLGALLGGGGASSQGGDLLGALLGGGQPAQGNQQQDDGLDMGDLLNAGMAFMNAKQQGHGNLQAALNALIAAGPLGQKPHRQQSGQVVANALLQAFMQNRK